jgi:mitochondrial fission protein ELM1
MLSMLQEGMTAPFYLWDGQGNNPYTGILGAADYIITPGDSVSMMSEACYTGKPVYIFDLDITKEKFLTFKNDLIQSSHARLFDGGFETWCAQSLDERSRLKEFVLARYASFQKA